jgi:hypothetical protein
MVKIKRFDSKQELTTKATAPQVNPSQFTGDLKATEQLGEFFIKKGEAFQKVHNFNHKTNVKISFGKTADQLEDAFKNDTDLGTVSQRSEQAYSKLVEEHAKLIDDDVTRSEFLLFAESQAIDARNRIETITNNRLLKQQKNDFEVNLEQDTERINKLQFEGRHDDAQRLAQESLAGIAEMERTFVIFPEVATERVNTLKDSISGKGQITYEIENMKTDSDIAVVEQHLNPKTNIYGLTAKELTESTADFNKIKKDMIADRKEISEEQQILNLQNIVNLENEDGTPASADDKIKLIEKAIQNGAANLPNGVDPTLGRAVKTQLVAQSKTVTDQRTKEKKLQTTAGEAAVNMAKATLRIDNNTSKDPVTLKQQQLDDAKLETVQKYYKGLVKLLDDEVITLDIFGEGLAFGAELLDRNLTKEAKALFQQKQKTQMITVKKFKIFPVDVVDPEFLKRERTETENLKLQAFNKFSKELYQASDTPEIKAAVKNFSDAFVLLTAQETINVSDGTPNGTANATTPAVKLTDEPSTATAQKTLKPRKSNITTQLFLDNQKRTVKVTFEDGIPIKREVISGD